MRQILFPVQSRNERSSGTFSNMARMRSPSTAAVAPRSMNMSFVPSIMSRKDAGPPVVFGLASGGAYARVKTVGIGVSVTYYFHNLLLHGQAPCLHGHLTRHSKFESSLSNSFFLNCANFYYTKPGGSQTCAVEGTYAPRTSRQERRGVLKYFISLASPL